MGLIIEFVEAAGYGALGGLIVSGFMWVFVWRKWLRKTG